jgi:NAD(P)-dependent dehydrogenase (short-subunit alcohol dehydrogenase family)
MHADPDGPLTGRLAVITGSNSGLGYETTLELARRGADVVMACRNQSKGEQAIRDLKEAAPDAQVELASLDLASLVSVRQFAATFLAGHDRLDILVNNAGVMALPEHRPTADGFEMQFGTNHLGHFALTGLLLPALIKGGRVVTVSSFAHRTALIRFDDLQGERRYRKWWAYGQSKLANLLFAFELDRRAKAKGVDLVSAAAHPGFAATHLQDGTSFGAMRVLARSAAEGAIPIVHAATSASVAGGEFFGPGVLRGMRSKTKRAIPSPPAKNRDVARRLWEVSEELTGINYTELDD